MFPATTNGGGECLGFPDVCRVPREPRPESTPFPNYGLLIHADAETCSGKVRILNKKVCTQKTEILRSTGDEGGEGGGVVSGKIMGPVLFKSGSRKVSVQGERIAHQVSLTGHNGTNANVPIGAQVVPSQTKVFVLP